MDSLQSFHPHVGFDDVFLATPILPSITVQSPQQQFTTMGAHESHPNFLNLAGLVSEAVMEVVFVAALGFVAARKGYFSGEAQKTVANLNIFFFTPCLSMSNHWNGLANAYTNLPSLLKTRRAAVERKADRVMDHPGHSLCTNNGVLGIIEDPVSCIRLA